MDWKIIEVYASSGHLVVTVEHYNPGPAPQALWFIEHYLFQGREGMRQRRAANALGQILLDDSTAM